MPRIVPLLAICAVLLLHRDAVTAQTAGMYSNISCPVGRYGNVTGQASIELGCPGRCVGGTYGVRFVQKTTGTCKSYIKSQSDCNAAAAYLGLDQSTSSPDGKSSPSYPPGCYIENSQLKFNDNAGGNGNTGPCENGKICICNNVGSTNAQEACRNCPIGKFGNVAGQTTVSAACVSTCPLGKHGRADATNRSTETQACICNVENSTKCPHLCPAGRYAGSVQVLETNGCPSCPRGRYHPNIQKLMSGKCSRPIATKGECDAAAKILGLGDVVSENDGLYNADYAPTGCYFSTNTGKLYVNLHGNNRGKCGSIRQCICNEPSEIIKKLCPNVCGVGKWGEVSGATSESMSCTNECPMGTEGVIFNENAEINPSSEALACKKCQHGSFAAQKGICAPCPIGYYGDVDGSCKLCVGDAFTSAEGEKHCKACPDGKKVKSAKLGSLGCIYPNSSNTCEDIPHNIGCEDDLTFTYIGFACLGVVLLGTCYCVVKAATKKPEYVDADESSVAHWRSKKSMDTSGRLSNKQQEVEATAVAIEMSNGTTVSVDRAAVNNKVNLIKLKLKWKKLTENITAAASADTLVMALNDVKTFIGELPSEITEFRGKRKELVDVISNKKAVSNLRKEIGVADIWTESVKAAVDETLALMST